MNEPGIPTPPAIDIDVPSLTVASIEQSISGFAERVAAGFTEGHAWVSFAIIISAFAAAFVARRWTQTPLRNAIDGLNLSFRGKRIARNISRLVFHVVALVIVSGAAALLPQIAPEVTVRPLSATAKLLLAWIFIRILAQIIENNFTRHMVATFAWTIVALSILGILTQVTFALDAVGMNFGDFRLSLLTLVKFSIVIFILLMATRVVVGLVERHLGNAADLTPSARVLIVKTVKVFLIALAVLIGVTAAGIDLSALAIFGGALGLGIGFGLQKVVSNLFSGMLLLIDKSIKPGDIIELPDGPGQTFGWVGHLGARYVSIITRDNKEYLIPNEDFITRPVINWSYTDRKIRVETAFGVDYASDPHQVRQLAIAAASSIKRIVSDPKPVCHLVEFGDSSLNFVLRYWIEDAENGVTNTKGDVMLALWDSFKENGIAIPYPHRVLVQK